MFLSVSKCEDFSHGTVVKNLPANAGDTRDVGSIPGQEDPLEKGVTAHSSVLAWEIPWTKEPGGLRSLGFRQGLETKQQEVTSKGQC